MDVGISFGRFIIEKRKEHEMTARELATRLGISAVYMCDIEKDRRPPVGDEILEKLRTSLMLTEAETEFMYDLAAESRNSVSPDLPEYIMENQLVRTALRAAKKHQVSDEKWERFIREIVREGGET